MKKTSRILAALAILALAGCASTNSYLSDRNTSVEMYHIFDLHTTANVATVSKAATKGLSQNTNQVNSNTPLNMNKTIPAEPGRFVIVDIASHLGNAGLTGLGAMVQMSQMRSGGSSMKAAKCDGAVWTTRANRSIAGQSDLTLYGCLYQYKAGYHLDTYAVFEKKEGGLMQISRDIAAAAVGTPEEWVNKTIVDMVRTIEAEAGAKVTHVEGQPEIGNLPWVDQHDTNVKVSEADEAAAVQAQPAKAGTKQSTKIGKK